MRPTTPAKPTKKVKSFSQQLRQLSNLEAAWAQVRSNAERSQSPEIRAELKKFEKAAGSNLKSIQSRLGRNSFSFKPATGIALKRKGKKPRPIIVAPIESRIVQRALLNIIQEVPAIKAALTAGFNFGGVPGSGFGVPAAIAKAVAAIQTSGYYIRTDIKSFFVDIPRKDAVEKILAHIPDDEFASVFRAATTTELRDIEKLNEDIKLFPLFEHGVAQGSALSPILCNLLLSDFDRLMNDRGIVCIRYIDDFILFAKDRKHAFGALRSGLKHLNALGLEAYNPELPEHVAKADHGPTSERIRFLGCELSKNRVRPAKDNVNNLLQRVEEIFDDCLVNLKSPRDAIATGDMRYTFSGAINAASNVIRGWGNTYSFCNDDRLMQSVDIEIDKRFSSFQHKFTTKQERLNSADLRRSWGLFLLADCNKDESASSARQLASSKA